MARYTIDGQIFTDLGDCIREAKFDGINPREVHEFQLSDADYSTQFLKFNVFALKNRITILNVEWVRTAYNAERLSVSGSDDNSEGLYITRNTELPLSIITLSKPDSKYISFSCSSCDVNVTFTVEPCDDNGEVIKYTYTPDEIVEEINILPIIPNTALELTGSFSYRFSGDNWNWFINNYGHLITTNKISSLGNAFTDSKELKKIPFDLNVASTCSAYASCFTNCYKLEEAPRIIGSLSSSVVTSYSAPSFENMFEGCYCIRELPDDYFTSLAPHEVWTSIMGSSNGNRDSIFNRCYSLRKLPNLSKLVNYRTSSSYNLYYNAFSYCYCLDEITNLPLNARLTGTGFSASSNMFSNTFNNCSRLKNMTFEMNPENGNPLPAYWNKQAITFASAGWASKSSDIIDYNSGITADKQVTDDASYQALKNDPDWWTTDMAYSRYNRASAVATINSLPDTSDRGGANTITFKGAAGSKTDAGAISDLTEAQIAVAAAKGWTVSLV